ncbi:ComF family protein [Synechococcus sp. RSCCF101]|uniref:ComF family protein n=1 Tax=Synechococcus sp. RSCCF101 TaxID=2511069 RepID=UPI0012452AFE|nr:phosphoribosyltransferase family protein [Synechococcus sp. RSCCF101]QEY32125.1 ComF family protein [Synechococcus sp. RSCCF101]
MWRDLLAQFRSLVLQPTCSVCQVPLQPGEGEAEPCGRCRQRLTLPAKGLRGRLRPEPRLPWICAGPYDGALRQLLLAQRRKPDERVLRVLVAGVSDAAGMRFGDPDAGPLRLQPIPSWKRRGNPLPDLIARALPGEPVDLLERSRATLGQHHLDRAMRERNQAHSFRLRQPGPSRCSAGPPLVLVDDILTTGHTVAAAARCLQGAGLTVAGVLCLARTPEPGRGAGGSGLRCESRNGDRPG